MVNYFNWYLKIIIVFLLSNNVLALEVTAMVTDVNGKVLNEAVVYLEDSKPSTIGAGSVKADIEQKSKQFNPLVTVIQTGSSVNFPNKDSVRHHVYSFSPAKKFELKLYSGVPANPVVFDKAGTVVLGCNIHDAMLAFVYIVDTPYFGKTDKSGLIKISNIPDGSYLLKAWHYALLKENIPYEQSIDLKSDKKINVKLEINEASLVSSR
jgi:plastocyanin